jgi:hypothetical protein
MACPACSKFWDERPMQRVAVDADAKNRPNRGTESLQNDERGNGPERCPENTAFCLESKLPARVTRQDGSGRLSVPGLGRKEKERVEHGVRCKKEGSESAHF